MFLLLLVFRAANCLAPTIEKWPAGPNFGRPYLLKFWVFLAGKKCNELGKKCSIQMNLHRKHKRLCLEIRFSSFRSFSANHFSNNQSEWIINNNNCICILMIDEQLVEGRWGSGFFASTIKKKPGWRECDIVLAHRSWTFAGFNPKGNVKRIYELIRKGYSFFIINNR